MRHLSGLHEVKGAIKHAKTFIQKSDKAIHQNSSWIAASLQFTFSRSQENKQLQTVRSATYQADKRNLQSVKAFHES